MRKPRFARVTVTLPRDLLAAADRLAGRLDRSRSWVLAESLRKHLEAGGSYARPAAAPSAVREPGAPTYAAQEVAEARRYHLKSDLQLSPSERLRRAEELVRLARLVHPHSPRRQIIAFDSYEDYYEWKKKARLAGA